MRLRPLSPSAVLALWMISSSLVPLPATAGEAAPAAALIAEVRKEDFLGFSYGFRPKHSQHDVRRILSFRWPEFD